MDALTIRSGPMTLTLSPDLGGSITHWRYQAPSGECVDLMRPSDTELISRRLASSADCACFPLAPYSNRIRDGRFKFQGRSIRIGAAAPEPHALHGHGWRRSWEVAAAGADHADLRYRHEADDWPFAYEMTQRFSIGSDRLEVELAMRNLGNETMPAGFGLHPYFLKTARTRLVAHVGGMWETDRAVLPVRLMKPPPAALDTSAGLDLADIVLDNCFTLWNGEAEIVWPERELSLRISAGAPLGNLVIYAPEGKDYFCVEPVSNITDAFNLAQSRTDTGLIELAPGASVRAEIRFQLQRLAVKP